MEYKKLKDTWLGVNSKEKIYEKYSGPVTMSLNDWNNYVASGENTLYGSGGVIPGDTVEGQFTSGAVYKGTVHQGYGGFN